MKNLLSYILLSLISTTAVSNTVTLSAAQFDFDFSESDGSAKGTGTIREYGFNYRNREYFEFFGVINKSDEKESKVLGLLIDDFWIEYYDGSYVSDINIDTYSSENSDPIPYTDTKTSEYKRIDIFFDLNTKNCRGGIFGDEICSTRRGISYLKLDAHGDYIYHPLDYDGYYVYEDVHFSDSVTIKSVGMAGNIEFMPYKIGFYRRLNTHIGIASIKASNLIPHNRSAADYKQDDASDIRISTNMALDFGLAVRDYSEYTGIGFELTLGYALQHYYTLPMLFFGEFDSEGEDRIETYLPYWKGTRFSASVTF